MAISGVNGTTTTTSTSSTTSSNKTLGKDDFLKLLITQLKNQDPLNPLDQNQFLAQTAQFTSLENLQNISSQLTEMKNLTNSSTIAQSAVLLGKTVQSTGRDFTLGTNGAVLPFTLDRSGSVAIDIVDSQGTTVRHVSSGVLDAGAQAVSWDGRDNSGNLLSPGLYHFKVTGYGGANAVAAQGTITGLAPDGAHVLYRIGDVVVRPEELIDVN